MNEALRNRRKDPCRLRRTGAHLLTLATLLMAGFTQAQNFTPIGGTNGNNATGSTASGAYPTPFGDYYENHHAQYLFRGTELVASGVPSGCTINAIRWNVTSVNGAGIHERYTVKVGTTTTTALPGSNGFLTSPPTQWGPTDYQPVAGSNTFNLATPFVWNGTDNILIEICSGSATASSGTTYSQNAQVSWQTAVGFNGSSTTRIDDNNTICANTTASGTQTTRPRVILGYCTGTAPGINPTNNGPLCEGSTLNLSGTITSGSANTFSWTGPNSYSSASQNPSITNVALVNGGVYTYTASNGAGSCSSTGTTTVTVNQSLTINSTTPTSASICSGTPQVLSVSTSSALVPTNSAAGGAVTITDNTTSSPYPSNIVASGLPTAGTTVMQVKINGFSHTYPADVDLMLQSPTGVNVILMSDVGDGTDAVGVNYVFQDGAGAMTLGLSPSGTYRCTNVTTPDTWVAPGPGALTQASPVLSSFTGNPNGTWKLFCVDDAGTDAGSIASWSIVFGVPPTLTYAWTPSGGTMVPSNGLASSVTVTPSTTTTYTITAGHSINSCTKTATVPITVTTAGIANAGGPYSTCGTTAVAISATANRAGTWSGGAGTFASATSASTTYTPTAGEIGTTVTLTWTTSASGPCPTVASNASLTVNTPATANAGGPYTTCGTTAVNITATANGTGTWSGGTGSFGSATSASTTYTPAAGEVGGSVTITWTTNDPDGAGPCASLASNATLNVNTPATADAGGPYTTCGTDAVNITATTNRTGSWSGGTGSFGSASSASTTYTPAAGEVGGSVTLTWTTDDPDGAGPCASLASNATLNVNTPATADAGGPYATCSTDAVSIAATTNGTGSWSGGLGSFASAGSASTTYTPDVSEVGGSVTLTWTTDDPDGAGPCAAEADNASLTVNALPVMTCPADITDACTTDAAFALAGNGENPAGGSFSGTGVSGGNFDPGAAGAGTHTITYSYTDGNTCTNTCTFDITVTQATPWYSDLVDGDGLGDPNDMVMACVAPTGYVADNSDLCPSVTGTVGSACDDSNCFTVNDVLDADCICTGTLVPCDNWTLTIYAGTNGGQISWQIVEDGGPCVLQSGSGYSNGSENNINVCVPQGNCFRLTFNDTGNDGIAGGGWKLVDNNGNRIVDNVGNGACFSSTTTSAAAFCNEPASAQTVIPIHCDKENWIITNTIIASADPAVSAQWGIGNQADDGYQFWFTSTCGTYSRQVFRNHATSGGQGPANALRATKLALATIVSSPLPVGELLNVRVRSRVNGVNGAWGPACRFRLDPNACTLTQLNSTTSSPNFSCGANGKVVGAGGNTGKIFADVVSSGGSPATHYRFQFSVPGEGYLRYATSTNAACLLGVWASSPLLCGTYTYDVRVQASFDGGTTYCPLGPVCQVTITNNQPAPYCTQPGGGAMMEQADTRMDEAVDAEFLMYPNPNRGDQLFVNMSGLSTEVTVLTVDIWDMFGKRAMTATLPVQDGFLNTTLALAPDMAAGLYMVTVTAGDITRTERLVIQR